MRGNICFDFFFSLRNHNIYILIVTRLFKQQPEAKVLLFENYSLSSSTLSSKSNRAYKKVQKTSVPVLMSLYD